MLYKIFLNIFILLITLPPAYAVWPFKKGIDKEKIRIQEIKMEIKEIKKNPEIYFGEAFADVKKFNGNLWETTKEARKRARQQLNEYIKVRVNTSLREVLKVGRDEYKREIEDITALYADKVLEEVAYDDYTDYPKKEMVTSIASVSKSVYKQTVLKELENKKAKIITHLRAGLKSLKAELVSQAIENFIQAKKWYEEFFHQVPLNMDLDNDGKIEEIGAVIDIYLTAILKSLEFSQKGKRYTYDLDGGVIKKPVVFVHYAEKKTKIPVSGLPLKAKFVQGDGRISEMKLVTGDEGEVKISVEFVNPQNLETTIQVAVDFDVPDVAAPFYRIELEKIKGVAYSVVFKKDGKIFRPLSLKDIVKSVLSKYNYDIEEILIDRTEPTAGDIEKAVESNTDYFLIVSVERTASSRIGDYDMYRTGVRSKILVYKLPERRLISSVEGPHSDGSGTSVSSAESNALVKIKNELTSLLEEEIKKW